MSRISPLVRVAYWLFFVTVLLESCGLQTRAKSISTSEASDNYQKCARSFDRTSASVGRDPTPIAGICNKIFSRELSSPMLAAGNGENGEILQRQRDVPPEVTRTQTLNLTDPAASPSNPYVFTSREATNTGSRFRYGVLVNHERLAGGRGNRTAAVFAQKVDATSVVADQIVGMEAIGFAPGGVVAQVYGSNPVCQLRSGSSPGGGCVAEEANTQSLALGVTRRVGIQVIDIGSIAPASVIDAAVYVSANAGAASYENGLLFGQDAVGNGLGIARNGTLINVLGTGSVSVGINLEKLTTTKYAWLGPQASSVIDGRGNITAGRRGTGSGDITAWGHVFVNGGRLTIQSAGLSGLDERDNAAAADEKNWRLNGAAGVLHFQTISDDMLIAKDWLTVSRSAAEPVAASFKVPLVAPLKTPASSSSPCIRGQFEDDENYHYVCVATNAWKRVALEPF